MGIYKVERRLIFYRRGAKDIEKSNAKRMIPGVLWVKFFCFSRNGYTTTSGYLAKKEARLYCQGKLSRVFNMVAVRPVPMKTRFFQSVLCLAALLALGVACRQQRASAGDIRLELSVSDRLVGETTLLVSVTDKAGNPVKDPGSLSIRGDMDHAGMAPVFSEASAAVNGIFTLPFEWTMSGGWILEASLTLDNGDVYRQSFRYEILNQADMANMNHSSMPGETSALYMRITNRGDDAVTIAAAETSVANQVEFHETLVENNIARMQALDSLVIAGGETLELRPGGKHIMLRQLTEDIAAGSQLAFRLILDSGERIDLTAAVADMMMEELDGEMEAGGLAFSQVWLRPASAGKGGND